MLERLCSLKEKGHLGIIINGAEAEILVFRKTNKQTKNILTAADVSYK